MPTKAEQARINGSKSAGPKTPEGLNRCRQASVKHGMWANHLSSFPQHEQDNHAAILAAATAQFNPRNVLESSIVALLADAVWRAGRLGALANCEIYREGWVVETMANEDPDLGMDERLIHAERASKGAERVESRSRHYVREINRLIETIKKLQAWPASSEASQDHNEIKGIEPVEAKPTPAPSPEPARKPVQSATAKPRKGTLPRRR